MTDDKETNKYLAAREAELDYQLKLDKLGNKIANYSARIQQAKESGDIDLANELQVKLLEATKKRREMRSEFQ